MTDVSQKHESGRPDDFDVYWNTMLDELQSVPEASEIEKIPIRSTSFANLYRVKLTSIGPYRIVAYLSIPTGNPPFPALFFAPGYGSVVTHIPQGFPNSIRERYATLTVAARGMRGSETPFEASFPGLLTEGVDSPETYIFRGIVADGCRAIEYLYSRPDIDRERIASIGGDLAVSVSGLTGKSTHLIMSPGPFFKAFEKSGDTQTYPLQEINDYIRLYPDKTRNVERSLSYLDPRWFAPYVKSKCRVTGGVEGETMDRSDMLTFLQAINGTCSFIETKHSSYKDGLSQHQWIATQLGFENPILPKIW